MNAKILIVSNSKQDLQKISEVLCDFILFTATDLDEAVTQVILHSDIALIVVDSCSIDINNLVIINAFKANDKYSSIKLIILTDSEQIENEIRQYKFQDYDFFRKPFNYNNLKTIINLNIDFFNLQSKLEKDKKSLSIDLQNTEALFETIFEQAPIGIAVGREYQLVSKINHEFEKIIGRNSAELKNISWKDYTHPDDLQEDVENFKKFKLGIIPGYSMIKRFVRPDGSFVWTNMIVTHLNFNKKENYGPTHICIIQDISDFINANNALHESERSKSVLLSHIKGIVYKCKLEKQWTMSYISEGCLEMTGYNVEDLLNNKNISFNDIICEEFRDYVWEECSRAAKNHIEFKVIYKIKTSSGEEKWVHDQGQAIYNEQNKVIAIEGLIVDITEQKQREIEIEYISEHDILTGLYNRQYFTKYMKNVDNAENLPLSVIVADINGVRLINNAFGQEEGDKLISDTANLIKNICDMPCIVARTGGNEFKILLPKTDFNTTFQLMTNISKRCEEQLKSPSSETSYSVVSLGCSTKNYPAEDFFQIIKNAEENMIKRKLLARHSSYGAIMSAIMATLFAKSQETERHAERLDKLSNMIGTKLNLSQHNLDLLKLFSMLHDVGKIGIDDRILNKPGKLDEPEWVEMKKHTEIGYNIANSSPELEAIAKFILTHHERWDGTGYPHGIKEEEIPQLSRILAVADAYDAMTAERIYRKTVSSKEAIEEIVRCSGTQFDPTVVNAFVEITDDPDFSLD